VLAAVAALKVTEAEGKIIVPVTINHHEARFAVDTGSFATVLNLADALRLETTIAPYAASIVGIGGHTQMIGGTVDHLRLGNLNATALTVGLADLWKARSWSDGLLGMDILGSYDLDFDTIGGYFVMYAPHGNCANPMTTLSGNLYDTLIEPSVGGQSAIIKINVDGRTIRALVDSATRQTVMFRDVAEGLGVDLKPLNIPGRDVTGGIGKSPVAIVRHQFAKVAIGNFRLTIW